MLVLLDTNIVARSFNRLDRDHTTTVQATGEVRRLGHTLALVPQCFYEYWVVATRPVEQNGYGLPAADASSRLDQLRSPYYQVVQDAPGVLPEWRRLVSRYDVKGKSAHDARLVAAMVQHGITHLQTWNSRHFSRYREIVALTPDKVLEGALAQE